MTRRCAIYARYSSDLQRESSIEDQVRRCREYAWRQGWPVVEDFVTADRAVSAASVAGRDGLHRLVDAAKTKIRPFDCVLIDDTSRLARYPKAEGTTEFYTALLRGFRNSFSTFSSASSNR